MLSEVRASPLYKELLQDLPGLKNAAMLGFAALNILKFTHQFATFLLKNQPPILQAAGKLLLIPALSINALAVLKKYPVATFIALFAINSLPYNIFGGEKRASNQIPYFLTDMSNEIQQKDLGVLVDGELVKQVERRFRVSEKPNVILRGKPGAGKSALMYYIAWLLKEGKINPTSPLYGKKIFHLNHNAFLSHTMFMGQLQERIDALVKFAKDPNVIIFIDELHIMMTAGASIGNPQGIMQYLKEPLSRNEIRIIGASTEEEYNQLIATDSAFDRRFNCISIYEPSAQACLNILKHRLNQEPKQELFKEVTFTDEALKFIIAVTFLLDDQKKGQPDKAITLMSTIASYAVDWDSKVIDVDQAISVYSQERNCLSQWVKHFYEAFKRYPLYPQIFPDATVAQILE
jgi:hypothetical protein